MANHKRDRNIRLPVFANRTCEGCNACCIVFDIDELDKKQYEPCKFLTEDPVGCKIHVSSLLPKACKDYTCPWIRGQIPEWMKPSIIGCLFESNADREKSVQIRELWKNASDFEAIQLWIDDVLQKDFEVIVIPYTAPGENLAKRRVLTLTRKKP